MAEISLPTATDMPIETEIPSLTQSPYSSSNVIELFDENPIALLEENFSQIKIKFDELSKSHPNLAQYYQTYPEKIEELPQFISIVNANKAALTFFSIQEINDLPQKLNDILSTNSYNTLLEELLHLYHGNLTYENIFEINDIDHKKRQVFVTINIPKSAKNSWNKVFISLIDVSLTIQLEGKLKESQQKFKAIIQSIPDTMLIIDDKDTYIDFYAPHPETLLFSPHEFLGKTQQEILPDWLYKKIKHIQNHAQNSQQIATTEYQLELPDKRTRYFEARAARMNDNKTLFLIRDITEVRETKQQNLQFEQRFISYFNAAPIGMITSNIDHQIIFENPIIREIFNQTAPQLNHQPIHDLLKGTTKEELALHFNDLTNKGIALDLRIEHIDVNQRQYYLIVDSIKIGQQEYLHFFKDITELVYVQQEMMLAKEHAEESDKLKTAFLNNISHQIRTPMNAIMGFSDLLADESITPDEKHEFVSIINQNGKILLNILNDIVELSRLDARAVKINPDKINVYDIFKELYNYYREDTNRYSKSHILFRFTHNLPEQTHIVGDAFRIKQILQTLLSNAFKFTEQGVIELGCNLLNDMLQFTVKDTGVGIDPKFQDAIFDRFQQYHIDFRRIYGGTGLGLSIAKELAILMKGSISVESTPKHGSTFTLHIPYNPALSDEKAPLKSIRNKALAGKIILVVEDVESNFLFLESFLKKNSCIILWAKDGAQAVEMALNTNNIDLILMDINLPKMNGYQATAKIKEQKPNIPIIAQTAYVMSSDIEQSQKQGCDDFLAKPISIKYLQQMLEKHLL